MTKLEQLIEELCPKGVKFYELGAVAHYAKERIATSGIDENNYVGVENLLPNKTGKTIASSVPESGVVIAFHPGNILIGNIRPYLRKIWLADCDGGTNGDVLTIQIDNEFMVSPKYLYYVLSSEQFFLYDIQNCKGAKMPRGSKDAVLKYPIPVPPLRVQCEIARILDNFTELTAELTAELIARKQQYEYYRDSIIASSTDNKVEIGSLGTLTRGKRFVHADAVSNGVPCVHYGELYTHYGVYANSAKSHIREELRNKMRYAAKGDVIIVGAGENNTDIGIGVAWCGEENVAVHDACYTLKHNQNPKYISYCLRTNDYHEQIKKYVSSGKICAISAAGISKAKIPLPSIEEQNRIVYILDRFDALYNDLSVGLPSEIALRQKQYEHYRDKLLTFKEVTSV